MTEENTHEKKYQFELEEKALCFHGPLIYEAKVKFLTFFLYIA